MASHDLGSHDPTQPADLSNFINKLPSNDWAHLSSVVTKEMTNICNRVKNLANEVCLLVLP